MECDRFKKLLKSWYLQVQDEALAPARMVELMENHISSCPTCLMDPDARKDMEKIITLVLPKDKLSPPTRSHRTIEPSIDGSGPGLPPAPAANQEQKNQHEDHNNIADETIDDNDIEENII